MKIQDIKIGEVYKTTRSKLSCWDRGDYFKVVQIAADAHGEPHVQADFNHQGFGQTVYGHGLYWLGEDEIETIGPKPEAALAPAFLDPDPSVPEWDRMGTAGSRLAGYLTALSHLKAGDEGRHYAHKAMVYFLKHIGYDEVASLYERFV